MVKTNTKKRADQSQNLIEAAGGLNALSMAVQTLQGSRRVSLRELNSLMSEDDAWKILRAFWDRGGSFHVHYCGGSMPHQQHIHYGGGIGAEVSYLCLGVRVEEVQL